MWNEFSVFDFLKAVCTMVQRDGEFVSKGAARERGVEATADKVFEAMNAGDRLGIGKGDKAQEILEVVKNAKDRDGGDYVAKLQAAIKLGTVDYRNAGLIGSAYSMWAREKKYSVKRAEDSLSDYFGEEGERVTLDVVIEKIIDLAPTTFHGHTVTRQMVIMKANKKDRAIWITGSGIGWSEGQRVKVTGTVKEHEEFRGVKNTKLTRVTEAA
jgi:hypothetical protein